MQTSFTACYQQAVNDVVQAGVKVFQLGGGQSSSAGTGKDLEKKLYIFTGLVSSGTNGPILQHNPARRLLGGRLHACM